MSMLLIKDLHHYYGANHALRGISLEFKSPSVIGLYGHNGSGKSTLLKILSGLLRSAVGYISLWGEPLLDKKRHLKPHIRARLGVLLQATSSDTALTVFDNLLYFAMMMGINKGEQLCKVEQTLKLARLDKLALQPLKTLSEGTRRRLELYRTFMHRPKVLFLDEPTAGLDSDEQERFWHFLRAYQQEEHALVLSSLHNARELEACDQVVMMSLGSIIAFDQPQLLKNEDQWRLQVETDQQGEVRTLVFSRTDLSEVYEQRRVCHA